MAIVYRYRDINDNIIKYVGIVNDSGRTLGRRLLEHFRKDVWSHGKFQVDYINVKSKTDAEFLEAHFISYYETFKYFNVAKKDWGISSIVTLQEYLWHPYIWYDNNLSNERIKNKQQYTRYDEKINNKKFTLESDFKYKIWKGSNNNWYTYVPDNTKKNARRLIKKRDLESLIIFLFEFYDNKFSDHVDLSKLDESEIKSVDKLVRTLKKKSK